jgi:hypothetical protein
MTDLSHLFLFLSVLTFCFTLYVLLLRRLAEIVQPFRLKMAEDGETLLASGLSERDEFQVRYYLDNAFSAKPMAAAAFMLPFFVLCDLVRSALGRPPPRISLATSRLSFLFTLSAFAANPLFGIIVLVEVFYMGSVVILVADPSILLRAAAALLRAEAKPCMHKHLATVD